MSEMIERVALALFNLKNDFDPAVAWEDLDSLSHKIFREAASTAIEAMREPTAEMLFVGSNDEAGFTERNLLQSWHLMIDEALALPQAQQKP